MYGPTKESFAVAREDDGAVWRGLEGSPTGLKVRAMGSVTFCVSFRS